MMETGVTGSFTASHDDPRGIEPPKHSHTYQVDAWFPNGTDGRDWLEELDRVCARLNGQYLDADSAWCEPLAKLIGEFLTPCTEVVIRRDDARIHGRWKREDEPGNYYRHRFNVRCPNNSASIAYELEIWTSQTIMVEEIVDFCAAVDSAFHEDLADRLHAQFGGTQKMRAHHHGVDIESLRVGSK